MSVSSRQTPFLSVLMSLYNRARFVGEAIESILGQDFGDFEFIILDDLSTDRSFEIVQQYASQDKRIRAIQPARHIGIRPALNRLLKAARGELIAVMESDDISLPGRFSKQVALFAETPRLGVVSSAMRVFDESGKEWVLFDSHADELATKWQLTFGGNCVMNPTAMFRSWLVHKHNLNYSPDQAEYAYDYMFWVHCMPHAKFANIAEPLVMYRQHPGQITQTHSDQQLSSALEVHQVAFEQAGIAGWGKAHAYAARNLYLLQPGQLKEFSVDDASTVLGRILGLKHFYGHAVPSEFKCVALKGYYRLLLAKYNGDKVKALRSCRSFLLAEYDGDKVQALKSYYPFLLAEYGGGRRQAVVGLLKFLKPNEWLILGGLAVAIVSRRLKRAVWRRR